MASGGSGSTSGMNKEPTCDDCSANPASVLSMVGDDIPGLFPILNAVGWLGADAGASGQFLDLVEDSQAASTTRRLRCWLRSCNRRPETRRPLRTAAFDEDAP